MKNLALLASLAVSLTLQGCGGGGGGAGTASPAAGLTNAVGIWDGKTTTSPPDFPRMILRSNGDAWIFNYDAFSIQGMALLSLSESGTSVGTLSGTYFSKTDGIYPISIDAGVAKGSSFGGSIKLPSLNASSNFSATFVQPSKPLVSALTSRQWDVGGGFTLAVDASGSFTATGASNCVVSGTFNPITDSLDSRAVTATTSATCSIPSAALTGLAYFNGNSLWMGLIPPAKNNYYLFYSRLCSNGSTSSDVGFNFNCQ
jgi:hypothetical protein